MNRATANRLPSERSSACIGRPQLERSAHVGACAAALLAVVVSAPALLLPGRAAARRSRGAPSAPAHFARVIAVRDKAELHRVRAFGETLVEEGKATGTLAGTARIQLHIDVARGTATASFVFYVRGGSISGRSSGSASGGHGGWESFSGTATIDQGTGRYAHASGTGKMYGAIYRRTDRLIVQDDGRLRY